MWTRSVYDLLQRLVVLPWGLLIHTQRVSVYLGRQLSELCFVVSHSVLLVYINGAKAWAWLWHFQMCMYCTLHVHVSLLLPHHPSRPFLLQCRPFRLQTWEQTCFTRLSGLAITSLSTVTSRSIHFPTNEVNLFFFVAEWDFTVCVSYFTCSAPRPMPWFDSSEKRCVGISIGCRLSPSEM